MRSEIQRNKVNHAVPRFTYDVQRESTPTRQIGTVALKARRLDGGRRQRLVGTAGGWAEDRKAGGLEEEMEMTKG